MSLVSWFHVASETAEVETGTMQIQLKEAIKILTEKEARCFSVGEWICKLWYIQMAEYYIALKRNGLSSHEKTWLKCTLLSEGSQFEKVTYYVIPFYKILEITKLQTWRTDHQGLRMKGRKQVIKGQHKEFLAMIEHLCLDPGCGYMNLHI